MESGKIHLEKIHGNINNVLVSFSATWHCVEKPSFFYTPICPLRLSAPILKILNFTNTSKMILAQNYFDV